MHDWCFNGASVHVLLSKKIMNQFCYLSRLSESVCRGSEGAAPREQVQVVLTVPALQAFEYHRLSCRVSGAKHNDSKIINWAETAGSTSVEFDTQSEHENTWVE